LGNDYLVWESEIPLSPAVIRAVCDRNRGVGSDGVLEPTAPGAGDYGVRIWNPDGSVAEKSGNGLRIFARWVFNRTGRRSFLVWTGSDLVGCELEHPDSPTVNMGRATLEPDLVPVLAAGPVIDQVLDDLPALTAVGLGNPHAVVFSAEALPHWRAWGPKIEQHPRFPHRTNVQFARRTGPQTLEITIWERGAGPTQASGSSACAVAVAAVVTGRGEPGDFTVLMPGGALEVAVTAGLDVRLRGPVEGIGTVNLDPAWLQARGLA
jgi:diaminopimelate epimerase